LNKDGRVQTTEVEFRGWKKVFCFKKCNGEGEYPLKVIPSFVDNIYDDMINNPVLSYPVHGEYFDSIYNSVIEALSDICNDKIRK
jgi:hypothetical protein